MGTEINWFEIHVLDLDRAEAFYKKIFNASFFEMKDYPYDARGITLNETPESLEGALVKHPSRRPSHEHGTILFFEVDDVDETVEHVKAGEHSGLERTFFDRAFSRADGHRWRQ